MSTQNMTLLSQEEIDILLTFLIQQKDAVSTNVLDQSNIDKLISIIRTNREKNQSNLFLKSRILNIAIGKNMDDFRLQFEINKNTNFIYLFAQNILTNEKIDITPNFLSNQLGDNDSSTWGYSISPLLFHDISVHLNLKYTKIVFNEICRLFALKNFGDANFLLPALYLPSTDFLEKCLID